MLTLTNFVNYVTSLDKNSNPKTMPAKLELEGMGTLNYAVQQPAQWGTPGRRITADDPTRTFKFVRAPEPGAGMPKSALRVPSPSPSGSTTPTGNQQAAPSRATAIACVLGAAIGASVMTVAAAAGASIAFFGGCFLLSMAIIETLWPTRSAAPREPRSVRFAD